MKILASNKKEFDELTRTFKYLHDFTVWYKTFNWKFWQWISYRSIFNWHGVCLDQEEYPLLRSIVHLYRIKYAHLEGDNGIKESEELKKIFQIDPKVEDTLKLYEEWVENEKSND